MNYSDDAFVTMLLCMALSPNKEEYARPYGTQEFKRLEERVHQSALFRLGRLLNVDISGLMMHLDVSEEEAYRIYTLLNRSVQLSYAVENYLRQGIEVVTMYSDDYPKRLKRRMGEFAPPVFYRCGNAQLTAEPMLAIVGISGVKTSREARRSVETLVERAAKLGYVILTGGELGIARVAGGVAAECGARLVEVLGGDMAEHMLEDGISEMLAMNRAELISMEHPEALFTVSHALSRNKTIFSLAEAAFIFNTDGKHGEMDAIRNRYCDWIYAWTGWPGNQNLLSRGALPAADIPGMDIEELSRRWRGSEAEQLDMFSLLGGDEGTERL